MKQLTQLKIQQENVLKTPFIYRQIESISNLKLKTGTT